MEHKHSRTVDVLRIVLPVVILAVGVGGFVALGGREPLATDDNSGGDAPLVETVAVEVHQGGMDVETDGVVVPFREIELAAEVAGRTTLKADICRAGNFVQAGTLLFEIDPRDYELEVERLTKELAQADVLIEELEVERQNTLGLAALAEEDLQLQRNELARIERLQQQRVMTDSELDKTRQAELASRNALITLNNQVQLLATRRNRLERAKELVASQLERARLDLQRTKVHAPVDGIVVEDLVEQNAYVQRGTPLATIEDTSAVEVRCSLKMEELHWLWKQPEEAPRDGAQGLPSVGFNRGYRLPAVRASVEYTLGGRRYVWQGMLSRYEGVGLDERTRTVPCRVLVADPRKVSLPDGSPSPAGPPALVRGMYVTVKLHVDVAGQLLKVPENAVRPGNMVWAVRDGVLSIEKVDVARLDNEWALFDSATVPFVAGDSIVVSPLAAPLHGMAVRELPPQSEPPRAVAEHPQRRAEHAQ